MSNSSSSSLSCLDGIAAKSADLWLLVGRLLLGSLFFFGGWSKLMNMAGAQGYLASLKAPMPELLVYISVPAEFILGVCLILGLATRYAAVLGMIFVAIATVLAHRYWEYPMPAQIGQYLNFTKNIAILGGMFYVFVAGAGRFSVDSKLSS